MKIGDKVLMLHNYYICNKVSDNNPAIELSIGQITSICNNNITTNNCHLLLEIKEDDIAYGYEQFNGIKPIISSTANMFITNTYKFWYHVMDNKKSINFLKNFLSNKDKIKYYNGYPIYIYPKEQKGKHGEKFRNNTQYIQYLIKELSE